MKIAELLTVLRIAQEMGDLGYRLGHRGESVFIYAPKGVYRATLFIA